ncbi:D-arabinono-1,4-lactone oxidase [Paenarthrobacter sp. NPDC089989]|uniref:D-arabinono-1,4-lactone oxidase n=1 Tax=unclassified Paenarthrobacter TaxID=2634190 RepID=UPI0038163644
MELTRTEWTNWFGNQSCRPAEREWPLDATETQEIIARAAAAKQEVRAVGGGHSLPAVVPTKGILLDLENVQGRFDVDSGNQLMTLGAGRRLSQIFDPLWDAGFAMKNMGELADSTIAGAVSTGAHGTGISLPCTSASVVAAQLVTASGDLLELSRESTPELLRAAQVSIGMLGIFTELTLEVVPAYDLVEHSILMSVDEVLDGWEEILAKHRHWNFYYIATPAAAAAFADQLEHLPAGSSDVCYSTLVDAVAPGQSHPHDGVPHVRRDRMNRILTIEFDPNYREIEYAVPYDIGKETFIALREMLRRDHPDYAFPMNVRFVAGDDAYLSAYGGGPRVVFSLSDDPKAPYSSVLGRAEAFFLERGGRPHWGKEHALTESNARAVFPDFDRFVEIRRELDPNGMFLNPHLKTIFA